MEANIAHGWNCIGRGGGLATGSNVLTSMRKQIEGQ